MKKNKVRFDIYFDTYLKVLHDLLQTHYNISPVLVNLIWQYHNCLDFYNDFFALEEQLFKAIDDNNSQKVERLLKAGADVDSRNELNNTPLHHAVWYGRRVVIQLILTKNPLLEARDDEGGTPLHCATEAGHTDIVELLINTKANIEARDTAGRTPLHSAITNGHQKITYLLINKKANLEARDGSNETSLHRAVSENNDIFIDLLLSAGADKEARTQNDENPLELAVGWGRTKSLQALLSAGYKTDVNILKLALNPISRPPDNTIIPMLLLQNRTLLASQEVRELLIAHSFDLPAFKESEKRMNEHLKKVAMLLEAHCSLPLVLGKLINEYHNDVDLLINLFTQAKLFRQETAHTTSEHSSGEEDDDWHEEEVSSP